MMMITPAPNKITNVCGGDSGWYVWVIEFRIKWKLRNTGSGLKVSPLKLGISSDIGNILLVAV